MRAFRLAASVPWAITQDALELILSIAARENLPLEAVEALRGEALKNTRTVTRRDGVATIPIDGPIFRRADMFTDISGATTVDTLATDFRAALDDPDTHTILFAVDSPGGEVNGVAEFADMVYAARGAGGGAGGGGGGKPILAYISDLGASAAYWIASAADEVAIAATAAVGSIGVICVAPDPRATSARTVEFVSTSAPNKRPNVATTQGRAQVQEMVDATTDIFVAAVARHRGVSAETVLADFGAGGLLMGQAAVDAGMADRVASYEDVLATAVATHTRARQQSSRASKLAASLTRMQEREREGEGEGADMSNRMSWRDLFLGAKEAGIEFGADDDPPVSGAAQIAPGRMQAVVPQDQFDAQKAETERLRAELAAERERAQAAQRQRIEADAEAFAEAQIRAGKLGVPQREAVIADYTQRATDDAAHPLDGGTSRVAQLTAVYAGAPQTAAHATYIGERVKAGDWAALGNAGSGDEAKKAELDAVEAAAREWAKTANGGKG